MFTRLFLSCFLIAATAGAQPAIFRNGIVNAASLAPVGLPNSSIAQGSMFSIFGTALGPAASPALSWPLQTTLGGVSVDVQPASGATQKAIILFVSPGQINAILPSATPVGAATATVTFGGETSPPRPFTVVKSSFGSLALNQQGNGPGVVLNYVPGATWPMNTVISALRPGQPAILWGTGLGPVLGDEKQPPVQGDLRAGLDPMELWVGGQRVNIEYAGRSSSAGQDQINFTTPNILGCYVPVMLKIGDVVSNTITIAIAPSGGVCQDTMYSNVDPAKVQASGLKVGSVALINATIRSPLIDSKVITASASFVRYNWLAMLLTRGLRLSVNGTCAVVPAGAPDVGLDLLDAGASLTLTGPDGAPVNLFIPSAYPRGYFVGTPHSLSPGNYTVRGPGGADVGAFTASLSVPAPFVWTNVDAINQIDRSAGLTINWTGASGTVIIAGQSVTNVPQITGSVFTCLAKAEDGAFTVPPVVLQALPPTAAGAGFGYVQVTHQPPETSLNASGLDIGTFTVQTVVQQPVNFY